MDVEQGCFRSLYGIRWPVLGSVRSNVRTHRLRRLRKRTSALSAPPSAGFSKTGTPRIPQVRFRTIALHEGFKERLLVFAISVSFKGSLPRRGTTEQVGEKGGSA
jgi:hypothetical protein